MFQTFVLSMFCLFKINIHPFNVKLDHLVARQELADVQITAAVCVKAFYSKTNVLINTCSVDQSAI